MYFTLACLLVIFVQVGHQSIWNHLLEEAREHECRKFVKNPNYQEELVIGQVWREYYTWHILSTSCQTTELLEATPEIIDRFKHVVNDSIEVQPVWENATMLAKNGKYEMLMFRDVGAEGLYKAVPNFVTHGSIMYSLDKLRQPVKVLRFALKLLRGGKFLMVLDCTAGLRYLLARVNDTVYDTEVLSIPDEVGIGHGYLGCSYFIKSRIHNLM